MSRIYFHSIDGDAEVSGRERAHMGLTIQNITWSFLEYYAENQGDDTYLILRSLKVSDVHPLDMKFLKTSLFYGHHIQFVVDGQTEDPFDVSINTALRIGNDPLKLMARLHGQCEIHAWVEGHNRKWLSDIIERGLKSGLYRSNMGWESAIELLRKSDNSPIVTSYSVCDSFPNHVVAGWEDNNDGDDWYEFDIKNQWDMAMNGLRSNWHRLEMKPDDWDDYYVCNGLDAFKIIEYITREESNCK